MDNRYHIKDIKIVLDAPKAKYQSGDEITGKVIVLCKGDLLGSVLTIKLNCIGHIKWAELPGLKIEGQTVDLNHQYLEQTYELPEQYSGKQLSNGDNEIPFSFKLPERNIPSTFDGVHGSIKYSIEAFISQTEIDESAQTETVIRVEAPFRDNLGLSVGGHIEKELSFFNLGSGKITLQANIRKKGYYPGETAQVICTVLNDSTADVRPRASVQQIQIFMCGERHKTVESLVTEYVKGERVEYERHDVTIIRLRIPDTLPLSMKTSHISVKYFIHITLDIPHAVDLHLNLPIIITNQLSLKKND